MIQKQTEILIKDNSGVIKGRCINTPRKSWETVGGLLTIAITKAKSGRQNLRKSTKIKSELQNILIVQTKKPIIRHDGSSVAFSSNAGVCVSTSTAKLQLAFKRIVTTVPFELKRRKFLKVAVGSNNLIKLAKNLV